MYSLEEWEEEVNQFWFRTINNNSNYLSDNEMYELKHIWIKKLKYEIKDIKMILHWAVEYHHKKYEFQTFYQGQIRINLEDFHEVFHTMVRLLQEVYNEEFEDEGIDYKVSEINRWAMEYQRLIELSG